MSVLVMVRLVTSSRQSRFGGFLTCNSIHTCNSKLLWQSHFFIFNFEKHLIFHTLSKDNIIHLYRNSISDIHQYSTCKCPFSKQNFSKLILKTYFSYLDYQSNCTSTVQVRLQVSRILSGTRARFQVRVTLSGLMVYNSGFSMGKRGGTNRIIQIIHYSKNTCICFMQNKVSTETE